MTGETKPAPQTAHLFRLTDDEWAQFEAIRRCLADRLPTAGQRSRRVTDMDVFREMLTITHTRLTEISEKPI